jgi:hypothetical protein
MCVSDGQKRAVAARRATVFGFDEARKKKLAKRNVRFRVFQADCSSARKISRRESRMRKQSPTL